ncbi:MAG TPA: type II toxin-antitoxin system VapC family toxin [Thermoanaerobaculia bacterium]|jgi:predicted nucleic acid-binding protein
MILIDTSALVDSLCGLRQSENRLNDFMSAGERFRLSTITFYEWLRGPRTQQDLYWQELFFPGDKAIPFGYVEAVVAAEIYRLIRSPRHREADIAIAATAISHRAALWTLNRRDFADIPGLRLL